MTTRKVKALPKLFNRSNEGPSDISKAAERKIANSLLPALTNETPFNDERIAVFDRKEIVVGKILGDGSFSEVYEVGGIELSGWSMRKNQRRRSRQYTRDECFTEHGDKRFAIKHLKKSVVRRGGRFFESAARDLVVEAKLLATLEHDNIISIHGMSKSGTDGYSTGQHDEFFIIMDRLDTTMDRQIWDWTKLDKSVNMSGTMLVVKTNYAIQLADALGYMHEHRIIYRDLKPQNIGLDGNHTIKLFDFGLSRSLPLPNEKAQNSASLAHEDDCYLMSFAGTPKYMAPEIFISKEYNAKADVYSWSVVFYEMLTLLRPYEGYEGNIHKEFVSNPENRPSLGPDVGIPLSLENVLRRAWEHSVKDRLSMKAVCEELDGLLDENAFQIPTADKSDTKLSENCSYSDSASSYASWETSSPVLEKIRFPSAA